MASEDIKEALKAAAIQIRDEKRTGANTALRVGSLLLAICEALNLEPEELAKLFLRKDKDDQTAFLLKMLAGAEFGDTIDSMLAGKGTLITPDGRIQTDRLEVRDSMTVMDLIINQLQGLVSDYIFSDVGKVESVLDMGDDTFLLVIGKQTDYDILALSEGDVLHQIVNSIPKGGTDYYSCWMRVLATNVNDHSVTVVLYPDSETPGGVNHAPVAGYNLAHKGNAVIPDSGTNERAQYWMLSSREGRMQFLQNVFKPILEDYNYALTVGKLPDIEAIRNLPVMANKDVGVVAQTIIAEKIYRFDYNGDIVSNKVDRGEWSLAVAQSEKPYRYVQHSRLYPDGSTTYTELEQHTVWHYGCKWGCLVDKTTDEPKWNSASWLLLEGDKNYYITFESSNGFQFTLSNMDTVVTAMVRYANRDITDVLMSSTGVEVEWLRDTGNVPMDNTWSPTYVGDDRHVIRLARDDMGPGWMSEYRKVKFTCRVHIPYGDNYETIENSINYSL